MTSLVLIIALAGCGGGTTDTATTTDTTGTTAMTGSTGTTGTTGNLRKVPTPSTLEVMPVEKYTGKYPDQYAVNIKFNPNSETPSFFKDALEQKKPIFVEFYAEGDSISASMTQYVAEVQTKYQGRAVFLLLDIDKPQSFGSLSEQLPVQYVPQIFIFNGESTIIRSLTGYTDKDRMDQGLNDAVVRGY